MGHSLSKCRIKKKGNRKDVSNDNFIRNGGILLEKQIAVSQGQEKGEAQFKVLSSRDVERATNGYDRHVVLANMISGSAIYKGTLDDREVVFKTFGEVTYHPMLIDQVLTEATIGVVMNHRNITKVRACCLETYVPVLAYEYLSNGGLVDQLHRKTASQARLKWAHRLRIATDIAYALSYMHTAFSKPVVHRDVKSMSVLVDNEFHAKLTNLGFSVSITPGDSSQKWPIVGTVGYIDPEYVETQEVTEKCDVYSFGVLMLELLTGKVPREMAKFGAELVDVFIAFVDDDCLMEIIDRDVIEQASAVEIQSTVRLALACVKKKGAERPTMVDVVKELWLIQGRCT